MVKIITGYRITPVNTANTEIYPCQRTFATLARASARAKCLIHRHDTIAGIIVRSVYDNTLIGTPVLVINR